mmetsp:Transcript_67809/g.180582  ORF Transcript_67809/g.180582 Transcript_67809/m.180582 type:complete len:219 (-) Transcript_67809:112-768(-)
MQSQKPRNPGVESGTTGSAVVGHVHKHQSYREYVQHQETDQESLHPLGLSLDVCRGNLQPDAVNPIQVVAVPAHRRATLRDPVEGNAGVAKVVLHLVQISPKQRIGGNRIVSTQGRSATVILDTIRQNQAVRMKHERYQCEKRDNSLHEELDDGQLVDAQGPVPALESPPGGCARRDQNRNSDYKLGHDENHRRISRTRGGGGPPNVGHPEAHPHPPR